MKSIEINWRNFSIILILVIFAYLFFNFYSFEHVGLDAKKNRVGDDFVFLSTKDVKLEFVPGRDNLSGVIFSIDKRTFIKGEENIDLIANIIYVDRSSGEIRNIEQHYRLNSLNLGGAQILNFPPLPNTTGQTVDILLRLSAEPSLDQAIKISANEYRVIYRENLKSLAAESNFDLRYDREFRYFYFGLIFVCSILLFLLLILKSKRIDKE